MAATLVNAVADIPASPTAGDIVRFGTAITSGIPSNVKKANGTTTETLITVGSEYRYIGTNWMRIGGDVIETTPLKDATVLASSEFADAILGAVHNDLVSGKLRQFGMSLLHQALQDVNPIQVSLETTAIFERDYGSEVDIPNRTESYGTINLDIESGNTRHSFADGYFGYLFIFVNSQTDNTSKEIMPLFVWQEDIDISYPSNYHADRGTGNILGKRGTTNPYIIHIRKVNDTSFKTQFYTVQTEELYLQKIIGYKLETSLETP